MKLLVFHFGAVVLSVSAAAHPKQLSKLSLQQDAGQILNERQALPPVSANSSTASSPPTATQHTTSISFSIGNFSLLSTSPTPPATNFSLNSAATTSITSTFSAHFTGSPSMTPNTNGYINYDAPGRPANQVDTVHNSWGIASTSRVEKVRFHHFCSQSHSTRTLCGVLHAHVAGCAQPFSNSTDNELNNSDDEDTCSDAYSRGLLQQTVAAQPCATVDVSRGDALTQRVCGAWLVEAGRCAEKTFRGPCAGHHVLYLLRQFVGLFGGAAADGVGK